MFSALIYSLPFERAQMKYVVPHLHAPWATIMAIFNITGLDSRL